MSEKVLQVNIMCDELPDEFIDDFDVITEGYYQWSALPVIESYGSPGFADFDIAIVNWCHRYDVMNLYYFIMQHAVDFEVVEAL